MALKPAKNMTPIDWALRPLRRYADFTGRAPRAEFWWFFPFLVLVFLATWLGIVVALGITIGPEAGASAPPGAHSSSSRDMLLGAGAILLGLFWLALIIPSVALQTRRLHDTNRSGWWVGAFYLLYAAYITLLIGAAVLGGGAPASPEGSLLDGAIALWLAMFLYSIALLVLFSLPGTKGYNRFGADPHRADVSEVFA